MNNIIKDRPSVGDIVVILNGKKKFVSGAQCTSDFINSLDAVGVVYSVQGNLVRIVGGSNTTGKQWSCVADYEITAIPSTSGDYAVTLNGVAQGNFTYTKDAGTIEEFTTQLNAWLEAQAAGTKAKKWEAYTRSGHSYLQMKTYDEYESTVTIASTTLVKLIGSELAPYTSSSTLNAVKQASTYNGMCRDRLEKWARNNADANCNPSGVMNGTTQLFETFPCSYAYYAGEKGTGLRAHFATYEAYLDACMCRLFELNKGTMQFRDGKMMTDLLKTKTVLKAGVETPAYSAADWAVKYNTGVEGFGAGKFWLPSMFELALLMRNIKTDYTDPVNVALAKKTGWSQINPGSARWSVSRYNSNAAWRCNYAGITNYDLFYYAFSVSAVSAFTLND